MSIFVPERVCVSKPCRAACTSSSSAEAAACCSTRTCAYADTYVFKRESTFVFKNLCFSGFVLNIGISDVVCIMFSG